MLSGVPTIAARAAIIVHGGAGEIRDGTLPERLDGCKAAAEAGWQTLRAGGSALDAVEAAVVALENNPVFNAGIGSTLNQAGEVEMDAALMEGASLRAGAVAAIQGVRNPIVVARRVLEDGRHVMLAGAGALAFARAHGVPDCPPQSLIVESERKRWLDKMGTVGAVALDHSGVIAVATSTGGVFNKLPGRVGDSPLFGCGTYADQDGGASCTGQGEAIIRVLLARTAVDYLRSGVAPAEAARRAVDLLAEKTGGTGGLILVDGRGRIGYARNTSHMPVCRIVDGASAETDC